MVDMLKTWSFWLTLSTTIIGALFSQGVIPTGGYPAKILTVYILVLAAYGINGLYQYNPPRQEWTDEQRKQFLISKTKKESDNGKDV